MMCMFRLMIIYPSALQEPRNTNFDAMQEHRALNELKHDTVLACPPRTGPRSELDLWQNLGPAGGQDHKNHPSFITGKAVRKVRGMDGLTFVHGETEILVSSLPQKSDSRSSTPLSAFLGTNWEQSASR